MKRFLILICFVFLLTACNNSTAQELCGYGSMFKINNSGYYQVDPQEQKLTISNKVGVIKKKIEEKLHPVSDFTSNTLDEGTEIYSVQGSEHFLIARTIENKFLLFQKMPQ